MPDRPRPEPRPEKNPPRPMTSEEARRLEEQKRRKMAKPEPGKPTHEDPVDESSDESFPASDPPAHGGGRRG